MKLSDDEIGLIVMDLNSAILDDPDSSHALHREALIEKLEEIEDKRGECVVAVSGGFDPIHFGHVRYFQAARKLGTKLQIWLTSDEWCVRKKGYVFMSYAERKEILEALSCVDEVLPQINEETDTSVESLHHYRPDIFAKGGDRTLNNIPLTEREACESLGIDLRFGVGGPKIQSSSWLVNKSRREKPE